MKVLHVLPSLHDNGIAKMLYEYCVLIKKNTDIEFEFLVDKNKEGILEDDFSKIGNVYKADLLSGRKKLCEELKCFFEKHKYDIVHANLQMKSLFVSYYAYKNNVPKRIFHTHTAYIKENLITRIKRFVLTKLICRYSTDLAACSKDAAKWMFGKHMMNKVKIINNAFSLDMYRYSESIRKNMREKYGILDNTMVWGYVARLTKQKGGLELIDVFKQYKEKNKNIKLVFVGSGAIYEQLVSKTKECNLQNDIIFAGAQKNVSDYLSMFDMFILPSECEGLGISYIEAQVNGLPTYAPNQGIPKEVRINENFVFYDKKDNNMLLSIIEKNKRIYDYKSIKENMNRAGYNIEVQWIDLATWYKEILD